MTFENATSIVNSPSLLNGNRRDDEKPKKKRIMSSLDMLHSERTLAFIGTSTASTSTASLSDVMTGENIRMITDLGKFMNFVEDNLFDSQAMEDSSVVYIT